MSTVDEQADGGLDPLVLSLPFTGRWITQNSPASRIPSHGTNLFGTRYAIDFVAVDDRGRTAPITDWGTWFGTEPPERFYAFGRPIVAPISGEVVAVHDGEADHRARRSQLTLAAYLLGQGARVRAGPAGIAGNHVVLSLPGRPAYIGIVHLRKGSLRVAVGDQVAVGDVIAECGNSGNSTQPHVHLQASSSPDFATAQGLPFAFASFTQWDSNRQRPSVRRRALPPNGAIVEPVR